MSSDTPRKGAKKRVGKSPGYFGVDSSAVLTIAAAHASEQSLPRWAKASNPAQYLTLCCSAPRVRCSAGAPDGKEVLVRTGASRVEQDANPLKYF